MTTKNGKELQIDTARVGVDAGGREGESPPSLLAATSTSTSALSETESLFTPRNQPIMTREIRQQKAMEFADNVGLVWANLGTYQKRRAMKVQSSDFTWSPNRGDAPPNQRYVTTFSEEWGRFVDRLPAPHKTKLSDFSNVFFDEEAVRNYMAIRQQLSGICSSHASVIGQHYVESYRAPSLQENHKMLDISSFILNDLPTNKKKRYIEKGTIGMAAFTLMKQFTKTTDFDFISVSPCPSGSDFEARHRADADFLLEMFEKRGPGLVSGFKVGREFLNGNKDGNPILEGPLDQELYREVVAELGDEKKKDNLHAMVLIGAYRVTNEDHDTDEDRDTDEDHDTNEDHDTDEDRYWFVLQNTHKDAYFKLIDSVHLASCGATVHFADPNTDMSLKGDYHVTVGEYSETWIDVEECASSEPEG